MYRREADALEPRLGSSALLACRVRRPDGTVFDGLLPAARHQSIQLGMLHHDSRGLIEIGYGHRPVGGKTNWSNRRRPEIYLPGGAAGAPDWLERALAHVAHHTACSRREIAVVPSVRWAPRGTKEAVRYSRWLWVDIDDPAALPALHAFLAEHPAHLRVWSGGSGGEHAYWRLARPLPAVLVDDAGVRHEWIERLNRRLIHAIDGADPACAHRNQPMRLAGTVNYKRGGGHHARLIAADFALPSYSCRALVGGLPDMPGKTLARRPELVLTGERDPYKQILAVDYFERLAGKAADARGKVRCPLPEHADEDPSCSLTGPNPCLWNCRVCDVGGTIYDLASLLLGGPIHAALRDAAFRAARDLVMAHYGPR